MCMYTPTSAWQPAGMTRGTQEVSTYCLLRPSLRRAPLSVRDRAYVLMCWVDHRDGDVVHHFCMQFRGSSDAGRNLHFPSACLYHSLPPQGILCGLLRGFSTCTCLGRDTSLSARQKCPVKRRAKGCTAQPCGEGGLCFMFFVCRADWSCRPCPERGFLPDV